jgi:hypothetical protein
MSATRDASNDTQSPLSVADFQELVAQYHHRLLSLEADLKDQARSGSLSTRAFSQRVKKLKDVHASLAELRKLCLVENPGKLTSADIGLPLLDDCTPAEREVCERFLVEKELELRMLELQSGQVYRWLGDAVAGYTNPLRIILRLSKMRKMIQSFEKRLETLADAATVMSHHIDKLVGKMKGGSGRQNARSTVEALMALFSQLDGTIARVARLKASVKKEEARTQAMSAWLRQQEEALKSQRETFIPPTPLATARAVAATGTTLGRDMPRAKRRRNLAEQYWQEVLQNGVSSADLKTLGKAKQLIGREKP